MKKYLHSDALVILNYASQKLYFNYPPICQSLLGRNKTIATLHTFFCTSRQESKSISV